MLFVNYIIYVMEVRVRMIKQKIGFFLGYGLLFIWIFLLLLQILLKNTEGSNWNLIIIGGCIGSGSSAYFQYLKLLLVKDGIKFDRMVFFISTILFVIFVLGPFWMFVSPETFTSIFKYEPKISAILMITFCLSSFLTNLGIEVYHSYPREKK